MKQRVISTVFIVGAAMWLAACSGGGDGGGGTPVGGGTPAAAPTLTGTFVDAPVAGLSYATSSGLSGATNSQGQFSYRSGDTVVFSYGQTVSDSIPATPQVTPWTVFGLNSPDPADPRWINLARLLQTFNNVLPPVTPAIQALPAVNFNLATADFGADPAVVQMLTTAPQPLVSAAQATQTLGQQFALLGSWFAQNNFGPNFVVFTAMADGTYVVSEDGSSDPTGIDGMERGTYTWDPATGAFTRIVQVDTNGQNGLSHTPGPISMTVNGNTLTVNEGNGQSNNYTRVIDTAVPANPAVGAWRFDNTDGPGTLAVLTLFANGTFVLVTDESAPVHDGMERGSYSIAPNGNATFTKTIDTNSDAGLLDPAVPGPVVVNIAIVGDTMTLTFPGEPSSTGTRIRPPQGSVPTTASLFMTVGGIPCTTPTPTPGCTFNVGSGSRVTVAQDPNYNSQGFGSDDMWYVQFNSFGQASVYNSLGVFQYPANPSDFPGHISGSTVGVGNTGQYWENVAGRQYWFGRNGVLYSANTGASNYGWAIN